MSDSSERPRLPAIGILSEMSPENLDFLSSYGKFVRPSQGEPLIEQDQPQDSLHILLSGILHVTASSGNRSMLMTSFGAGDAFGEVNLFDPAAASATVTAKSDCLVWKISGTELKGFFAAEPAAGLELTRALLHSMSRHLRAMNSKLAESEEKAAFHSFWNSPE